MHTCAESMSSLGKEKDDQSSEDGVGCEGRHLVVYTTSSRCDVGEGIKIVVVGLLPSMCNSCSGYRSLGVSWKWYEVV